MAVELINSDDSILPEYELILLIQDTQCKVDIAMKHFVQYMSNKTHPIAGILGYHTFILLFYLRFISLILTQDMCVRAHVCDTLLKINNNGMHFANNGCYCS